MFTNRRSYALAKDQPILEQARRRRRGRKATSRRTEADFWKTFNIDKFAADWRRGVGKRQRQPRAA